jgi:hypothetical protein
MQALQDILACTSEQDASECPLCSLCLRAHWQSVEEVARSGRVPDVISALFQQCIELPKVAGAEPMLIAEVRHNLALLHYGVLDDVPAAQAQMIKCVDAAALAHKTELAGASDKEKAELDFQSTVRC